MLITCPTCQAKFRIADEKVSGRSVSVRCRSCQASIQLGSAGLGSSPPRGASTPSDRPRAAPPPQNDESSQMFTLAALVGRATSPASAHATAQTYAQGAPNVRGAGTNGPNGANANANANAKAGAPKREGSGVIDLNALAAAAEERARRAQSEAPPSAFARDAHGLDEPPPVVSRKLRYAGIAAAAGLLAIVGLIVAVSGGEDPKPRAAAAAIADAPKADALAVAATASPASTPAPTTDLAAATSPQDDAKSPNSYNAGAKPKFRGAYHASSKGAKIASGPKVNMSKVQSGGLPTKSAAPAPAKAKPAAGSDPCNCKGNLQCAIKCFK